MWRTREIARCTSFPSRGELQSLGTSTVAHSAPRRSAPEQACQAIGAGFGHACSDCSAVVLRDGVGSAAGWDVRRAPIPMPSPATSAQTRPTTTIAVSSG